MPDETINLALPYILPSQAQKHVTHNEALQRLDAVTQLVIAEERAAPPETSDEGTCYVIAAAATGAWSGKPGLLAFRQDGAWLFIQPRQGWRAWFVADDQLRVYRDGEWDEAGLPASGSVPMFGINATADETNRLAVASPASLFNHAGGSHQMKVNKATPADTASLLFQSAWLGRAEMGLAGGNDFAVKISPDGAVWKTGLSISPQGVVNMPNRPLARASLTAGTLTPAAGGQTGFDDLHMAQGGFSLAEAVAGGPGHRLAVPVDGLYLLFLNTSILSSSGHTASLVANGSTVLAATAAPASTSPLRQNAAGLALLAAGDGLTLLHSGTAQFEFGNGKTEIIAVLL